MWTRKILFDAAEKWLSRETLTDRLPEFLHHTEQRIFFGGAEAGFETPPLRMRLMEKEISLEIVEGKATLPTDYLEVIRFCETGGNGLRIQILPANGLALPGLTERKYPVGAAIVEGQHLRFLQPGDLQGSDINLRYYASLPALSSDEQTNDLLSEFPSLYLSGLLAEAFHAIRNQEQMLLWLTRFRGIVKSLNESDQRSRTGHSDWTVRPDHIAMGGI